MQQKRLRRGINIDIRGNETYLRYRSDHREGRSKIQTVLANNHKHTSIGCGQVTRSLKIDLLGKSDRKTGSLCRIGCAPTQKIRCAHGVRVCSCSQSIVQFDNPLLADGKGISELQEAGCTAVFEDIGDQQRSGATATADGHSIVGSDFIRQLFRYGLECLSRVIGCSNNITVFVAIERDRPGLIGNRSTRESHIGGHPGFLALRGVDLNVAIGGMSGEYLTATDRHHIACRASRDRNHRASAHDQCVDHTSHQTSSDIVGRDVQEIGN